VRPPAAVIVTGATGALGSAVVGELVAQGTRVAAPFRHVGSWRALQDAVRQRSAKPDLLVGIEAAIDTAEAAARFVNDAAAALGTLDGVALVAGGWSGGARFEASPADEWDKVLRQNLDTAAHVCRAALPHLLRGGGSVVAVGSHAALTAGSGMVAYAVAKTAVHALVRVLALENRGGVRVNAVLPGTIDTPANRRAMPGADRSKWTSPDAIARVMVFLLSPDSAPTTGALVPVDAPA